MFISFQQFNIKEFNKKANCRNKVENYPHLSTSFAHFVDKIM